MLTVHKWFI